MSHLLHAVLRGAWLIDPRVANAYLPKVGKMIQGERVSFYDSDDEKRERQEKSAVFALRPSAGGVSQTFKSYDEAPEGSIAVITLRGVVMKEDNCGDPGTATIKKRIQEANNHPNIGAVLLVMDSGGGAVDGTFELADEVAASLKPLIAFVDGMACSAGYGIICGAREIFASHATAEIGSIGTACTIYDSTKALEEWGYKMHYINADASVDKNQDYFEVLKSNYAPIREHILNPTNNIFLDTVRKNRSGKLDTGKENTLTGKVYLAEKAQAYGLIDGIKSFDQAVARAFELVQSNSNSNHFNMKSIVKKVETALAGKPDADTYTPTAEELSAMGLVAHSKADFDAMKTAKEKADSDLTAETKKVTDITAERDSIQAKLDKKPGENITTPGAGNENTTTDKEMWDAMNNLEHNKLAVSKGF